MGFSSENIAKVRSMLSLRKSAAEAQATQRLKTAYQQCKGLKELDESFPKIGQAIVKAFAENNDPEKTQYIIEQYRKESLLLEEERAALLKKNGFDENFTSPHYFCEECQDTGYVGVKMCRCMRRELVLCGYESSGLGALLSKQSFDNFSLDYYCGEDRYTMEHNLNICRAFVEDFGKSESSLLFMGNTGLGKTHLSTSIASAVIEKGFDVVYETAQNLIAEFSRVRFGHNYGGSEENVENGRYFDSDLFIIDDFGTEESNQFSTACFYNLINTRQSKGLSTVINTNLTTSEIRARYTDRIASRLFGEFTVLSFPGKDVRMQKLYDK